MNTLINIYTQTSEEQMPKCLYIKEIDFEEPVLWRSARTETMWVSGSLRIEEASLY